MILRDYSLKEIKDVLKEKRVVFFGAGNVLEEFRQSIQGVIDEERILCIVDNDVSKQGKRLNWNSRSLKIESVEYLCKYANNIVIIITSVFGYDINMQLSEIDELKDTECCYYKFIYAKEEKLAEEEREYPRSFRRTKEQLIPKIIHYCWFGNNPMPKNYSQWMVSWKKYCPDYEIIRWDENNYDFSWSQYMREAYENKKWAFVSDVARLDVVYAHGGIYLDTDVELIKPLDDLLYQNCFFGVESGGWINTGHGFGAEKGHRVIKKLIELYSDKRFIKEDGRLDLTSCPILQRTVFEQLGYGFDGNMYLGDDFTIYPQNVFCPMNVYDRSISVNSNTISIHHYDCSWNDKVTERNIKDELMRSQMK